MVIENSPTNIITTVTNLLATTSATIKAAAEGLFMQMVKTLNYHASVPPLANCLVYANLKARAYVLNKLSGTTYSLIILLTHTGTNRHCSRYIHTESELDQQVHHPCLLETATGEQG